MQQLANAMAQQQNNQNASQQPIINQQDNVDYINCTDPATIIDTSLMKVHLFSSFLLFIDCSLFVWLIFYYFKGIHKNK